MSVSGNDDHPNIIKMPDEAPTSEYGLGYEIFQSMKQHGENIAQYIVETNKSQTYAELLEECIKVAINLRAENLSCNDVVGLCLDNHKDVCIPYIACFFLGIKVLPMSNSYVSPEERSELLLRVKPKIIFADENVSENLQHILKISNLNIKLVVLGENSFGQSSYSDYLLASEADVDKFSPIILKSNRCTAVLFSGSGTSGKVKAVCLSHHTLLTRTNGVNLPTTMILTKTYWISHFIGMFTILRSGSTRIVMEETTEINIWKAIEKYKVCCLLASIYLLNNLINYDDLNDIDVSSLKFVVGGGIPIPASTMRKLRTIVPGVIILPAYGITEIGGTALTFNFEKVQHREWFLNKPTSCGMPIEGIWYKEFDFDIKYLKGANNVVADAMSRIEISSDELKNLENAENGTIYVTTRAQAKTEEVIVPRDEEKVEHPGVVELIKEPQHSIKLVPLNKDEMGSVKTHKSYDFKVGNLFYNMENKVIYIDKNNRSAVNLDSIIPVSGNDDHPNIIKMPDEAPTSEYGLGYEIFQSMKQHGENIAQYIVETNKSQTYAELLEECIKVAINLRAENLSCNDVVGLCMDNHKDVCVPYIACFFLGIKVLPMSNGYVIPEERSELLRRVKPKIIFADEKVSENLQHILKISNLNIKLVVLGENSFGQSSYSDYLLASEADVDNFLPIKLKSNRCSAVFFSGSGTSGEVKAVCLSHHTLLSRTHCENFPTTMILTRMYWISHFIGMFTILRSGSTRIAMEETTEINIWKAIEKYKVCCLLASVYQLNNLINYNDLNDVDVSSLKFVVGGGIAIPASTKRTLRTIVPGIIMLPAYGLTEIGGTALTFNLKKVQHREWFLNKPTSCGMPIEGIWYKVVDPITENILGPNELGELRLKSNLLMVEYYNMGSSDVYDADGWFKTGDIFKYDEDRCFFMIERMKEMIRTEGVDIVPTKLEHLLLEHPMVNTAAVIGIPQTSGYEIPLGIVTLNKNCMLDPKELEEFINSKVNALHRLTGGVRIIQEMPMTGTGKILKRTLRQIIQNGEL